MLRNLIIAGFAAVLACSCGKSGSNTEIDTEWRSEGDTLTHHSRLLTLVDKGGGVRTATIADPWSEGRTLAEYVLVDVDSAVPDDIPEGAVVVRTPVSKAAVFSAVHTSAIEELGKTGSIVAVADGRFFPDTDTIAKLLKEGRIADIGPSELPSAEHLAASGAEILLRSPMQASAAVNLPSSLVPVEMADYLETGPIARAEWLLLIGELFGNAPEARRIFDNVLAEYSDLSLKAKLAQSPAPKVLTDTEINGVWYIPTGESFQARLLADAGAAYPWADTEGSGSMALSLEEVANRAIDADLWLVRSFGYETTPATLRAANSRYTGFKAWKDKKIYSCNTESRPIFNDIAFHPERVLADYVAIFHPELMPGYQLRYFVLSDK